MAKITRKTVIIEHLPSGKKWVAAPKECDGCLNNLKAQLQIMLRGVNTGHTDTFEMELFIPEGDIISKEVLILPSNIVKDCVIRIEVMDV